MMTYSTDTRYCTQIIEPPCTERYARWCERSATQLMGSPLLGFGTVEGIYAVLPKKYLLFCL